MSNQYAPFGLTDKEVREIVEKMGSRRAALRFLRGELVLAAAVPPPQDELFQLPSQATGAVRLDYLLGSAPQRLASIDRLAWYLEHPEAIPESWKGKLVYFPETERRVVPLPPSAGYHAVSYLFWSGERWCEADYMSSMGVGKNAFVAVPTEVSSSRRLPALRPPLRSGKCVKVL